MAYFELTFESKQGNGRCGTITSRKNTLNTPCVFLDTQGGLPTFLTTQQLKKANLPKHGYVVDLGNIFYISSTDKIHSSNNNKNKNKSKSIDDNNNESKQMQNDFTETSVLHKFYKNNKLDTNSFNNFVGMEENMILLHHQSIIYREPQQGTDKCIVLTTNHGKKKISMQEYMHHIKNVNADFSVIPSENILSNSSKSRCQKNVNRTLRLLDNGLKYFDELNMNQSNESTMIISIEGGSDIQEREKCCNLMMNKLSNIKNINYGFMIGGIGFGESSLKRHEIFENIMKILENDKINKNKIRIVAGCDILDDILLAICNGCDIIISAYCTKLTQSGYAMVHPISPNEEKDEDDDIDIDDKRNLYIDMINIADICYSSDPLPILKGCKCYACTHHSRAYIRHLFDVHEMNAQILLQMHNSYRFLQFVENAKEYLRKDKLSEFCQWWLQYQTKII